MSLMPKILVSTRFSFFGLSGWKSEFSVDPDMLFDPNRLLQRFWLFEHITLPSLALQTDKDFHYFVLSSDLMPDWAQLRLTDLCEKHLGGDRYTVRFAPKGVARKFQSAAVSQIDKTGPVAQVVLDDDDALSCDFIANLKTQMAPMTPVTEEGKPHFFTFPSGYALGLRENETVLWKHSYKFINLGLTMVGTARHKNIFGISHRGAPKRFGFDADYSKPMYIRTLSNVNDSHVTVKEKWSEIADWQTQGDVVSRFNWLPRIDFDQYHALQQSDRAAPLQY